VGAGAVVGDGAEAGARRTIGLGAVTVICGSSIVVCACVGAHHAAISIEARTKAQWWRNIMAVPLQQARSVAVERTTL
jgi:hypothetical protein